MKNDVIGIVGGMGPEAGAILFDRILRHTHARCDQEHLPVMLMSFPGSIVDRTLFLEGRTTENPAYNIASVIMRLERAGAGVIGIACNTSYCPPIYDAIQDEIRKNGSRVNLLHMPLETVLFVRDRHPEIKRIGLMTTNGSYKYGLYRKLFEEMGLEVVVPDVRFQEEVIHRIIYDPGFGIKSVPARIAPEARKLMADAIRFFMQMKSDAVLLGCTELSVFNHSDFDPKLSIIDPLDVLARALIREARCSKKVFQVE